MEPTLAPYLTFTGNASDAMKFYHSILGGELSMQTFEEAKMAQSPEDNDKIIHATLKSDSLSIMASDGNSQMQVKFGDNVSLSISGSDYAKLTEVFNKLAEGGKVQMPLAKQFWGDTFGMCTDKFGIHWMVNITSPK
jgi:PhnB protein